MHYDLCIKLDLRFHFEADCTNSAGKRQKDAVCPEVAAVEHLAGQC